MTERHLPFDSAVATGKGDDGTTGLLFGGPRVAKDDPRTEAYGTIDEAVAALGMARAELGIKKVYGVLTPSLGGLGDLVLRLQRELFVVAAELATTPEGRSKAEDGRTRVSQAMVDDLGQILAEVEAASRSASRVRRTGRDTDERRARAGEDHPAASRAPSGQPLARRWPCRRVARRPVPQSRSGPPLDPGSGGRAGRGASGAGGDVTTRDSTSAVASSLGPRPIRHQERTEPR